MGYNFGKISIFALIFLTGCQSLQIKDIASKPAALVGSASTRFSESIKLSEISVPNFFNKGQVIEAREPINLKDVFKNSAASEESRTDFLGMVRFGVERDPSIQALKEELLGSNASVDIIKTKKEFHVSGKILGGIEDLSDKSRGVAFLLNAQKLLYDAGEIEAEVLSAKLLSSSGAHGLTAKMNDKAKEFSSIWVNLDKYQRLDEKVQSRLQVLGPLIEQLEEVASAGIGDVSQVAAAQRTVSMIRVTETDINERLERAKIDFVNVFGGLPKGLSFDGDLIDSMVPSAVTEEMGLNSPAILAAYDSYLAAEAQIEAVKARNKFKVGLEARTSRPFVGSTRDSEEALGLVVSKTLFNGGLFDSEVEKAEALANTRLETVKNSFRRGDKVIRNAEQAIKSMDKAIRLAAGNLNGIEDEIAYLRQQLLIGGSTLDSILRAEARLYEAEAAVINFEAQRRHSQLVILSALGLFFD